MPNHAVASRRTFLQSAAALSSLAVAPRLDAKVEPAQNAAAADFSGLKPLGSRVKPITPEEFRARLDHAQKLMAELKPSFDALFFAPGTSLYYFTGIRWGLSERLAGVVLPRQAPRDCSLPSISRALKS